MSERDQRIRERRREFHRAVHVRIRQVHPRGPVVRALAGDGAATPGTDGGWSAVSRPKRKGFIEWTGNGPMTMDVPIMLDAFAEGHDGHSVEAEIRALVSMQRKPQGPLDQPPVVAVDGATVPHRNVHWVLQGIQYGEVIRRDTDGARVRQALTLQLLEYVTPDVLGGKRSPAKDAKDRNKGKGDNKARRTYTVKHGDTLGSIAAHVYGDRNRWRDIAKLNDIRDPHSKADLKVGRVLRLP